MNIGCMTIKLVLIVDPDKHVQDTYQNLLSGTKVMPIRVLTPEDARWQFLAHAPQIDAVVLNPALCGIRFKMLFLASVFRNMGFTRPIITTLIDPRWNAQIKDAGCSHESERRNVPATLIDIFGM